MNKRSFLLLFLFFALGVLPPGSALADRLSEIQVQGAQRIEVETVKSYLTLQEGGEFSAAAVRESIRSLYDTGFFKDVSVGREGSILVVRVIENPMVNKVTFEGNDAFDTEELEKLTRLKVRKIYNRSKAEGDLAILRQAHRIKGLFLAKIDLLIEQLDRNRVNLVYRIDEGEESVVQEVRIIGNEIFSDREVRKGLMIQPNNWLSWWNEDDSYDREKLLFDQEEIRNFYLDEGYIRVRVDSSVAELTPDRTAFVVTHTVHEGKRYKIGEVTVDSDFTELAESELFEQIELIKDDWFSRMFLRQSVEQLTDLVGDFGYAFVDVSPQTEINDETMLVNLNFRIRKGRRVYLNRIQVKGNTRTRDEVIRREMRLAEGDRYSAAKIRLSKKRLTSLDFFEKIEFTTERTVESDRVNVNVDVEEKSTGSFTVGAGFSSYEGMLGTASISQKNFLGRGQFLGVNFSLSSKRSEYNVAFTEPYFMGKNMSLGGTVFRKTLDRSTYSSYKQRSTGARIRAGFPLSENLFDSLSLTTSQIRITNVESGASQSVLDLEEKSPYFQAVLSNSLSWDNLDDRFEPTTGRKHKLVTDYSGLGGDVNFVRLLTAHSYYTKLIRRKPFVGHIGGKFGIIEGVGEDVPAFERFYLGGPTSLRGFNRAGVGPRTTDGDDAYGGSHFEQVNMEILFPLGELGDKGVRGVTFIDAGILGDLDSLPSDVYSNGDAPRVSAGVGVNWSSPFGPMRFNLGFPLMKEEYDETEVFDFSFGTTF